MTDSFQLQITQKHRVNSLFNIVIDIDVATKSDYLQMLLWKQMHHR